MPIDDMRINPLGFQMTYYQATEIKNFNNVVVEYDDNKNKRDDDKKL